MSGTKRKFDDGISKTKSKPFYVSKADFFSLLNIGDMIEQSGCMQNSGRVKMRVTFKI